MAFDSNSYQFADLGQQNLSGDTMTLFRDQFIPYLLTQFDEKRVIKNLVLNKTITKGKSATFPIFGKSAAAYFKKGDRLNGQTFAKNEKTIYIDPLLVWNYMFFDLDEKMSETADRQIIAEEGARALANLEDRQLLQVGILGARADANIVDGNSGTVITADAMSTDAATLAAAIYSAGVKLDDHDVPDEDRYCFVRPLQYSMLAQYENIADKNIGGGSYEKGTTGELDNIKIIKTNHLPNTVIEEAGENNTYSGDFSKTAALILQKTALATVSLAGLKTSLTWEHKDLGYLMSARVAQGHGYLRPEALVELADN